MASRPGYCCIKLTTELVWKKWNGLGVVAMLPTMQLKHSSLHQGGAAHVVIHQGNSALILGTPLRCEQVLQQTARLKYLVDVTGGGKKGWQVW